MLTLLLADSELERVPSVITGHPQVATSARRVGTRAGRMLLDASLHHSAMRKLEDAGRRGRPDIIHLFLLTALESPVNHAGKLRVLVHTREGYLVKVDPNTRIVRNYNRFCGLIEQLFETGKVPTDKPLLTLEPNWTVKDVVASLRPDRVIVLDETATYTAPWNVFAEGAGEKHTLAIIGGFPSGSFRSSLPEGEKVGFGPDQLTVWTVAAELLMHYERWMLPAGEARTRRPPKTAPVEPAA